MKTKLVIITTVPISLKLLLKDQLIFLKDYFEVIAISSPGFELEDLRNCGIVCYEINFKRQISVYSDVISLFKLFILFKKINPKIIHSFTPKAGFISMFAGFLANVPSRIHTFTGLIFPSSTGLVHILLKNIDKLTCLFSTKIIPEGEGVKSDLLTHKITKKDIYVIGNGNINGINLNYYDKTNFHNLTSLQNSLNISNINIVFCFVGRIVRDKGINELIEAFVKIYDISKNSLLLIIGSFENEINPINDETTRIILNHPGIRWVGFQNDIRPYLAISNVFVLPSYREGFPNSVLQAGAMELPSIVTDINGCNEIIEDGTNGIIIPPKNSSALFSAMVFVIEHINDIVQEMAKNARPMIAKRYEQSKVWKAILKEYKSLE